MGTSISTTRVTTYHGYPGHLLPAPGDYPLRPTEGPPDSNGDLEDLWEAEPLTLKTQNDGNDDYDEMHFEHHYDSNFDDCDEPDWIYPQFNPQIITYHKGK